MQCYYIVIMPIIKRDMKDKLKKKKPLPPDSSSETDTSSSTENDDETIYETDSSNSENTIITGSSSEVSELSLKENKDKLKRKFKEHFQNKKVGRIEEYESDSYESYSDDSSEESENLRKKHKSGSNKKYSSDEYISKKKSSKKDEYKEEKERKRESERERKDERVKSNNNKKNKKDKNKKDKKHGNTKKSSHKSKKYQYSSESESVSESETIIYETASSYDSDYSDSSYLKKKSKGGNDYSLILSIGGGKGDYDFFDDDEDEEDEMDIENEECNSDDEKTFMKENYQALSIPDIPKKKKNDSKKNDQNAKQKEMSKEKGKETGKENNRENETQTGDVCENPTTVGELSEPSNSNTNNVDKSIESEYLELIELKKDFIEKLKKNPKNKIIRKAVKECDDSIKKLIKSTRMENTIKYRKLIRKERQNTDEFDYFKKKLSNKEQQNIMKDLEEINNHIYVEKPYRLSLLQSKIPAKYKAIAMQKLNMLKSLEPGDPEYSKLKNWVDCFMKIPFGIYKNLSINMNDGIEVCNRFLGDAKEKLDNCVYGLEDAKIQIMQMMGQWITNPGSLGSAIAIKGPPGTGKCHTYDTPIMMFDGTIKMVQDIRVGDVIMGDDSTPRNVLSLGSGMDDLYEVYLNNGEKYGVNSQHILCVKDCANIVVEIPVCEFLKLSEIQSLSLKGYKPRTILSENSHKTGRIATHLKELGVRYYTVSEGENTTFFINDPTTQSFLTIKPKGYGQYYGFEIDGNHRYLLGNFSVTHNTSLVKEGISKILGREFAFIALGGASDSSFLEGHSYTYEGSSWGKIVQILIDSKCMNPVIYFDELDKISETAKGQEIVGILTHLTDTSQNSEFHDKYFFEMEFDLSKCLFIFSYNNEELINPILKDRMYRIQTKGYDAKEKVIIARKYLLPKIREQVNFNETDIIIPDETIEYIVNKQSLTKGEDGVRNLKRCLEIIYTKLNLFRLITPDNNIFEKQIGLDVKFPFTVLKKHVDILIKPDENNLPKSLLTMYI
jgi:ATP-dependent Lon protease